MNNVILIGRLTNSPELRYTQGNNQMAVCKFNLAIDRGKDSKGNDKGADFPRVTVFGKQGENASKYLEKGRLVAIQGRIQTGSYKDKEGKTVYTTDVIAEKVKYLEYSGNANNQDNESAPLEESPLEDFAVLNEQVPW